MARSVEFGAFTIERTLDAPAAKVFTAFADKAAKEKWFGAPSAEAGKHAMDFQIGGHETASGTFHGGMTHRFEATYYDIVPDERIVYAYEMYINDERISVSVATITMTPEDGKTKLTIHEDGTFLDGLDRLEMRERGTHDLVEALAATL